MKAIVWRSLLLMISLPVIYVVGRAIYVEVHQSKLYTAGDAAAAAGRWSEAFAQFRALVEIDPNYRDAQRRLDEAIRQVTQGVPEKDLNAEIELLRWLATTDNWMLLAEMFDRSVISVPAGEFLMGSNSGRADEQPPHQVYLDAFEIDRYEVTNVQYQRFLKTTGRLAPRYWIGDKYPPGQSDYPVVGVSWTDADAYCTWAGKRLPTEAEWEKACRGTDSRLYPWGEKWEPDRANVEVSPQEPEPVPWEKAWALLQRSTTTDREGRQLRPVGSYPDGASVYGVLDLVGNASEWVSDWYNWSNYEGLPDRNPQVTDPPWNRCLRGSPWFDPYGSTDWVRVQSRCSARNSSHETQDPRVGFRCARSIP